MKQLKHIFLNDLSSSIIHDQHHTNPIIISIAGNIAVGKSTFAKQLQNDLQQRMLNKSIDLVCTDNFLYSNTKLKKMNNFDHKGFPDSYDQNLIENFIESINNGNAIDIPMYDHHVNDISNQQMVVYQPDILIIEGLISLQHPLCDMATTKIFLDADSRDVFQWYAVRCHQSMPLETTERFNTKIMQAWQCVDVPNYQKFVVPTRKNADMVLSMNRRHELININYQHSYEEVELNAVYN
ncbi:deoxynucleoside kinase [Paucilactobacillus suebicus]|uniref:deoxynucleoside kinase n=1 Tax=Paucilactobacillus suebicus TaxID=152335 RepID=UPI0002490B21|nr:deoxynucleoside kinase [Paucilactobacillus suebicus]